MESNSGIETDSDIEIGIEDIIPKKAAVILHNDDYTTMEFVMEVLQKYFDHAEASARAVMLKVHHNGKGIAGVYPIDIAETKVAQVTQFARKKGFPLRVTCEPLDGGGDDGHIES